MVVGVCDSVFCHSDVGPLGGVLVCTSQVQVFRNETFLIGQFLPYDTTASAIDTRSYNYSSQSKCKTLKCFFFDPRANGINPFIS